MGYERDTTPTLDAMAEEGLVFANAVASGVPTVASMTAVMTGEHSLASPELGNARSQREQVTTRRKLAEVLSEAGYSTGGLSPNLPTSYEPHLDRSQDMVQRSMQIWLPIEYEPH